MIRTRVFLLIIFLIHFSNLKAQDSKEGKFSGNFQTDIQTYRKDSLINATLPAEKMLMNSYANFNYTKGNFSAGTRFEGYMNQLKGFVPLNSGIGFPYRWAIYIMDDMEITVGNYYEQFGNGLIFRSYEDKTLGLDNAMDGIRIKYNLGKGIYLKGIWGKQRHSFIANENGISSLINGQGIVRGIDGEVFLNDAISKLSTSKTMITLGSSLVSKFEAGSTKFGVVDGEKVEYKLPENVAAYAGRLNISRGNINIGSEYAYKINDPSLDNGYIYKNGEALLVNATYSKKGFGVLLSAKRVDNMSFRSERDASLNNLNINYLPAITKNHAYTLSAMYPYASQLNGEIGYQAEVFYKFNKETLFGGKYGTNVSINFSRVNNIDKAPLYDGEGYRSDFFAFGDELFYQDFNVEINKKISKKLKVNLTYMNLNYNYDLLRGASGHDNVKADIGIADVTYKLSSKKALRVELQSLTTKQDLGDWAMGLVEYSVAPHWYFTVQDQYNYGNEEEDMQIHYYNLAVAYSKNANRIQLSYGKQRAGVVCVGGVCRNVPASNGLMLSITSSF